MLAASMVTSTSERNHHRLKMTDLTASATRMER
jgi:hypothetical protein